MITAIQHLTRVLFLALVLLSGPITLVSIIVVDLMNSKLTKDELTEGGE